MYDPDKNFFLDNSAMTLTLALKTCFKVTAHPLPKRTLQLKYEPYWAKGREDTGIPQTSNLGWTNEKKDGKTEKQID